MDKAAHRIALNTVSGYIRLALSLLISLWIIPVLIDAFGPEAFGLWSLLFSVLGIMSAFDFGLGVATMKFVAYHKGTGDIDGRNRAVTLIFLSYLVLTFLAGAALWILGTQLVSLFSIPAGQQETALTLVWILGPRVLLGQFVLNLCRSILLGEQRMVAINLISAAWSVVYAGSVWMTIAAGGSLVDVAVANLLTMLGEYLCYAAWVYINVEGLRFDLSGLQRSEVSSLFNFSGYQGIQNIAHVSLLQMDIIIIQYYLALGDVAIYAVALKISTQIRMLTSQFINTLTPYFSQLHGEGDLDGARKTIILGIQLALVPGLIAIVAFYSLGNQFIQLWIGTGFAESASLLNVLMLAIVATIPATVCGGALAMSGKHAYTIKRSVTALLVNAVLSVFLVQRYGLMGVAVATAIAAFFFDLIPLLYGACKHYQLSLQALVAESFVPALVPALVQALFLYMMNSVWLVDSISTFFVHGSLGAAIYLVAYWSLTIHPDLKGGVKLAMGGAK